jgi:hypothetical protein
MLRHNDFRVVLQWPENINGPAQKLRRGPAEGQFPYEGQDGGFLSHELRQFRLEERLNGMLAYALVAISYVNGPAKQLTDDLTSHDNFSEDYERIF